MQDARWDTRRSDVSIIISGMSGGLVLFSADGCDRCRRLKAALASHDVVYTNISLSQNPERIYDLVSLCGRNGVPQVFVEGRHIGGGDETMVLLENGGMARFCLGNLALTPAINTGPVDPRLAPSASKPNENKAPPPPPPRDETKNAIILPDEEMVSILEMTSILTIIMPRADLSYHTKIYRDCFTGRDGVDALMEHYELDERGVAVELGKTLQKAQLLEHVCGEHEFSDSQQLFFRLQPYRQPSVLNSFCVWTDRVDPNFMAIVGRLKKLMDKIESRAASPKTGIVDYQVAESDPHYLLFEEQVCELQEICLPCIGEEARRAFMINLYNLMVKHAYIKVGVPKTSLKRASFFANLSYNVGGTLLTFSDIEHGILRGNKHPPYHCRKPFKSGDKRADLVLPLDPRVHFALNCGAKSCPPVKDFTVPDIDKQLDTVSEAFVSDDGNVSIDEENNTLALSMIFHWYRADFADAKSKLPIFIVEYLHGDRKKSFLRMMASGKKIRIEFKPYDWGVVNAEGSKEFDDVHFFPNEAKIKSLFFSGMSLGRRSSNE